MYSENIEKITKKISSILDLDISWGNSYNFSISIDNKFDITMFYDDESDSFIFYSSILDVNHIDSKYYLDIYKTFLSQNLFGVSDIGGNVGLHNSGEIIYSYIIERVSNIDENTITEDLINKIIDSIDEQIRLTVDIMSK